MMERIANIERTRRVFKETDTGLKAFYQGYDLEGNEVALLTGREFQQWLQTGYVEPADDKPLAP